MSILDGLFDLIDPQLKDLRQRNASLNAQYNQLRTKITNVHDQFITVLNDYRGYVAYNTVLLISSTVLTMDDTQFQKYLQIADTPASDITSKNKLPQEVINVVSKGAGGTYILNAIYKFDQIANDPSLSDAAKSLIGLDAFDDTLTAIAYSGLSIIPGFDESMPAPLATVLSLPLEITAYIAAAGLDFVLMPYKVFEETSEYETANANLRNAVGQLSKDIGDITSATQALEEKIAEERQGFLKIMEKLNGIQAATFNWQLSPQQSDAEYMSAMTQAVMQYGIINILRIDWENVRRNNAPVSWDDFVTFEIGKRDATHFTPDEVRAFATLVRQSSSSMQSIS